MAAVGHASKGIVRQVEEPDVTDLVIEADEPVDSIFAEKQARLLTEPLYSTWAGPPRKKGQRRDRSGRRRINERQMFSPRSILLCGCLPVALPHQGSRRDESRVPAPASDWVCD